MKTEEMRTEYRREDLGKGVRGKHYAGLDGKSMLPARPEDTESFLAAVAGTLGDDFPNDITDATIRNMKRALRRSGYATSRSAVDS